VLSDLPLEIVLLFTSYDGKIATTTKSDKLGKYSITLKPGKYFTSKSDTTSRLPLFVPQIFEVKKGAYTEANLKFNSGIK
jgi:5-hydroxyisourate hydrolase-like protein (transthyretin family)